MTAERIDPVLRALARSGRDTSDYDLNPGASFSGKRILRPAAVLVPFYLGASDIEVILTKRSSRLKHHPGQIAFPGGKVDEEDAGAVAAALRETREEIGLPESSVELLGQMHPHETVTGFTVTPVLGLIRDWFDPCPEVGEVDEVFTVPLRHVADPSMYRIEQRLWRGEMRRYYVVPYGPYYIWGATARILKELADRMTE